MYTHLFATSSWSNYWQKGDIFNALMRFNAEYCLQKMSKVHRLTSTDRVLEIGFGEGHFIEAWQGQVATYCGVDVSESYVTKVKQQFSAYPHIHLYPLPEDDYLNFSFLEKHGKFNFIWVMSVLQYYKNIEEVHLLITELKNLAAPNAVCILADLIVDDKPFKDLFTISAYCLKRGKLFTFLRFMWQARFSQYYQMRQKQGLLQISADEWATIIEKQNLRAHFINEPLTPQSSRKHLMIQF
ncbi:MAG: class I SAM-dependent methyltransferase [Cytophagales bacterium]|nr:MAG: class I SAM-dependent methyltransferase [Cytophagales bacterium]